MQTINFIFSLALIAVAKGSEWQVVEKSTIDIKPGAGVVEATLKAGPHVCKFVYKTQGGTKEIWDFYYSINDKKESRCVVSRPGSSYLFFEEFSLSVDKAKIITVHLEKQPDVIISENEYLIDHKATEVKHSPGNFKSQLNHVALVFKKKGKKKATKTDL